MSAKGRRSASSDRPATLADSLQAAGLDPLRASRLEQMNYEIVVAEVRTPFREPGMPRPEAMFLRLGVMSKYRVASDGSRQIVALRFPGEPILPRLGPAPYGLQALAPCEIFVADGRELMMIAGADPDLLMVMSGVVQRNESIAFEWLVNRGSRDAASRVVHLLLETAARCRVNLSKKPLINPFTQEQIAQITGQSAVNVNRVFADLQRHQLIERKGREIKFKRLDELRRMADFDPGYLRFHH